jgi:hypothetical protein
MNLKYLYHVLYKDGSTYVQNAQDTSLKNNECSAFFDVDIPNVKRFTLTGEGQEFVVDLETGEFKIDQNPWSKLHTEELTGFKLIYFRRITMLPNETEPQNIEYHMGWRANSDIGETIEHVLLIT